MSTETAPDWLKLARKYLAEEANGLEFEGIIEGLADKVEKLEEVVREAARMLREAEQIAHWSTVEDAAELLERALGERHA